MIEFWSKKVSYTISHVPMAIQTILTESTRAHSSSTFIPVWRATPVESTKIRPHSHWVYRYMCTFFTFPSLVNGSKSSCPHSSALSLHEFLLRTTGIFLSWLVWMACEIFLFSYRRKIQYTCYGMWNISELASLSQSKLEKEKHQFQRNRNAHLD